MRSPLLPFVFAVATVACSKEPAAIGGRPQGDAGSSAAGGRSGMSGETAGTGGSGFGNPQGLAGSGVAGASGMGGAGGTVARGPAGPEVCDGADNDGNGIADDLDAEEDGVCDCLNIATIGRIGPWSNGGNVFRSWLDARSPKPAVELGDQVLTDALLAPIQVIVVLYTATMELNGNGTIVPPHHAFGPDEVAALRAWVERGGGVMTTIGYTVDEARETENVNRLIAPFGVTYSPTKTSLDGYIESWMDHPVSTGVSRIYTMNGTEPDAAAGTTVARDPADRVALQVAQAQLGRVVVWGDEWITYDSQWEQVQDQQVERLWLNILKWLSPPKVCQVPIKGPE